MTLPWHAIEGEILLEGDYSKVLLQEDQRQILLLGKWNLWICDLDTLEVKHMLPLDSVVVKSANLDTLRQRLYIGTEYGNKLLTIDLNSLQIIETPMRTSCRDLAISITRQQLYWLSSESMGVVALKGKKPRLIRQSSYKGKSAGLNLRLSPNNSMLALARRAGGELYRAENFSFRAGIDLPEGVHDINYSLNGEWLASVGGLIHSPRLPDGGIDFDRMDEAYYTDARLMIWNSSTGELVAESTEYSRALTCVVWHPQLSVLVTDGDDIAMQFWEWDAEQKQLHPSDQLYFPAYHGSLRDLVFTRDGQHLLALSSKGLLEFRLEGIESIHRPQPLVRQSQHSLATRLFHADQFIFHAGYLWIGNSRSWAQYDPNKREILKVSEDDEHAFKIYISPEHQKILRYRSSNNSSNRIEVRSFENELLASVRDIPKSEDEFSPGYRFQMRLENDGNHIIFIQEGELNRVSIASTDQWETIQFESGSLLHASLKTPPNLAVTIGGSREIIRLWNTETFASAIRVNHWSMNDLTGFVTDTILGSDGLLALGSSKGEVRVYDLKSGFRIMRGARHREGRINGLAFDAEGLRLASAAQDGTVRLWDVKSGEELAVLVHEGPVQQVIFNNDLQELVTLDQSGLLQTWSLSEVGNWSYISEINTSTQSEFTLITLDESGWTEYRDTAERRQLALYAERSWKLHAATPPDQAPFQKGEDLIDAYQDARRSVETFKQTLEIISNTYGAQYKSRSGNGLKDANRSVEKMHSKPRRLPADLLGGTLILPTVSQMYDLAEQLGQHFTVVSFRDRMIHRTPSLYGDLQFLVSLNGHLAEVKIQHLLFHQIDAYEHRLYESQRSIDAQYQEMDLPVAEQIVGDTLAMSSRHMYTKAWRRIVAQEEGLA